MKKIIVIGAGIAGLSTAIHGRQKGFEVEVYESHSIPGGECTGWSRKGYHIDNCIHWLTGTKKGTELYSLWENIGAIDDHTILHTTESFVVEKVGDTTVHLYTDIERLRKHLKEISPEDTEKIDEYCNLILIFQDMEMPIAKPMEMMNILDYIELGKKMGKGSRAMGKLRNMTIDEYFNGFKHPALRKVLRVGMTNAYAAYIPFFTMATVSAGNGAYPMGGSLQMARRIEQKAKALGATVHYNKEVKRIVVSKGYATGIELVDGTVVKGDYIVPANDLYVTMYKLLEGKYKDKKIDRAYSQPQKYTAPTSVTIGVGVACDLSHYDQDYMTEVTPFKLLDDTVSEMGFKLYCHEKDFAPEGHSVIAIQLWADYDRWKALSKNQEAYKQAKEEIKTNIIKVIEEVYPEAKGKVEMIDVATPVTYERYCGAYKGSWMAFHMNKEVKSFIHTGKLKNIKNIFMAGQWLQAPGGLPVAAATGKWAIQRICKQEKIK